MEIGEVGNLARVGLAYGSILVGGTEPLCADLCMACGTVARLHVKHADRKWPIV